jgi:hypothetical protein
MTKTYDIVAYDTDSDQDCGFTVQFDRPYLFHEGFPITERAAIRATEDAYDWFPTTEMIQQFNHGQKVGELVVEDREYVRTRCTV